ncbi:metal-dependent hydrolase [Halanaerobaculum tunisiense]
MTYHTHSFFGFALAIIIIKALATLKILNLSYLITGSVLNSTLLKFYTTAIIGGLIPDIDHANSKAGKKFWFLNKPLKFLGIKHRGLTHSLLGLIIFAGLSKKLIDIGWIEFITWLGLLIGYLSHIVADMFNKQGVPLFFPNRRRFKFHTNITTGDWGEQFFFLFFVLLTTILIVVERGYLNLNNLLDLLTT